MWICCKNKQPQIKYLNLYAAIRTITLITRCKTEISLTSSLFDEWFNTCLVFEKISQRPHWLSVAAISLCLYVIIISVKYLQIKSKTYQWQTNWHCVIDGNVQKEKNRTRLLKWKLTCILTYLHKKREKTLTLAAPKL